MSPDPLLKDSLKLRLLRMEFSPSTQETFADLILRPGKGS